MGYGDGGGGKEMMTTRAVVLTAMAEMVRVEERRGGVAGGHSDGQ